MPIARIRPNSVSRLTREAEGQHRGEGADDRHRDGRRRDQGRPPVLEEDEDHDQDQDAGLEEGDVDLADRLADEDGRVVGGGVFHPGGEVLLEPLHRLDDLVGHVEGVGAGELEDGHAGGGLARDVAPLVVDLAAELDPGHVLDPGQARAGADFLALRGLDDDLAELLGRGEPAEGGHGVLEALVYRRRGRADLAGGDLDVLLLDRREDVERRQVPGLELLRVDPDPHAVVARPEDLDVADPIDPAQLVLDLARRVVAQGQAAEPVVPRAEGDDEDDRRRLLLGLDALALDLLRQPRLRDRHPVLDQDLRDVEVDADLEGDGQVVRAVAGAGRGHVEHALDAVDFLLDREATVSARTLASAPG